MLLAAAIRLTPWFPAAAMAVWCGLVTGLAADETPAAGLKDMEFTLKVHPRTDDNGQVLPLADKDLERTKSIIGKRIKACTTHKTTVTVRKPDTLLVQITSLTNQQGNEVRQLLTRRARLELHEVSQRNDEVGADGKTLAQLVFDKKEIVPGYRAYTHQHKDADGKIINTPILLSRRVALSTSDIARAAPSPQQADAIYVILNGPGTDKMIALTSPMRPGLDRIAIVLDGEVISAPVVQSVPLGREFIIEGLNEAGEVQSLAAALMHPLEYAIQVMEMRTISQSLKQQ